MTEPYPKGTRVEKIRSEPGDGHQDGAPAEVLDAIGPHPDDGGYGYFVEWDSHPGLPCFIAGYRLRRVINKHHQEQT